MTFFHSSENEFYISTDKTKLDVESIHEFLSGSAYWSIDIPKERVIKAIQNSK